MNAEFLPSIFVPIIGFLFPFVVLNWFFSFIEKENLS